MILYKKAQNWSLDLIIAAVVFIMIITVLFTQFKAEDTDRVRLLQQKAKVASLRFQEIDSPFMFIDSGKVDEEKLNIVASDFTDDPDSYYVYSKNILDLQTEDYCFYFEDQDGNLLLINNSLVGIGSSDLNISGYSCGSVVN